MLIVMRAMIVRIVMIENDYADYDNYADSGDDDDYGVNADFDNYDGCKD